VKQTLVAIKAGNKIGALTRLHDLKETERTEQTEEYILADKLDLAYACLELDYIEQTEPKRNTCDKEALSKAYAAFGSVEIEGDTHDTDLAMLDMYHAIKTKLLKDRE